MKNALTVDVEDYFHVAALAEAISVDQWDEMPCRVESNTMRLLDMFDEGGAGCTFFILGWVADRYPQLVREIAARGHEVACHGQSHQLIYNQTPAVFREETLRAKATLEDICQKPVEGYRAASYSITKASLWALDILAEAGFVWDSSIFPVHHDRYGIADAPRWPHELTTPNGATLVEFPPTTVQLGPYRLPMSGGGYFRLYPYSVTRWGLNRVNRKDGQPFVFYLHPWEIDPEQPRVEVSRLSRFRHYNKLDQCEQRLRKLIGEFEFTTVRNVLEQQGLLTPAVAGSEAQTAPCAV